MTTASATASVPDVRADELVVEGETRFRIMADSAPVALWMAGTDAKCDFFNQTWLDMTGRSMEDEVGDGWAEGVHPMDFQICVESYLIAFHARRPFEVEYRLRVANGEYRWILDHGVPRFTPAGAFAGFIGSCIDITERKRAETERAELLAREQSARVVAEAAVRLRDEFLSVAAHELKSPVTGLLASSQVLERQIGVDGSLNRDLLSRRLQSISRQSRRLGRLVEHLLDLSRIQLGRLVLQTREVDLAELVPNVVGSQLRDHPARDRIQIDGASSVHARVDQERFEQVLMNLIDNAVKFSPDGGAIVIDVDTVASGAARVAVRDHGIGIPAEHREQIFNPLHQAHAREHRSGLGLGLYITRQIIEAHGGEIQAEFPPDGGTRFVVLLPPCAVAR